MLDLIRYYERVNVFNCRSKYKEEKGSDQDYRGMIIAWRRRPDSNRRIKVLQTSPLATWVRRHESIVKQKILLQPHDYFTITRDL